MELRLRHMQHLRHIEHLLDQTCKIIMKFSATLTASAYLGITGTIGTEVKPLPLPWYQSAAHCEDSYLILWVHPARHNCLDSTLSIKVLQVSSLYLGCNIKSLHNCLIWICFTCPSFRTGHYCFTVELDTNPFSWEIGLNKPGNECFPLGVGTCSEAPFCTTNPFSSNPRFIQSNVKCEDCTGGNQMVQWEQRMTMVRQMRLEMSRELVPCSQVGGGGAEEFLSGWYVHPRFMPLLFTKMLDFPKKVSTVKWVTILVPGWWRGGGWAGRRQSKSRPKHR